MCLWCVVQFTKPSGLERSLGELAAVLFLETMIDDVYYMELPMAILPRPLGQVDEGAELMLTLVSDPAMCEVLDHLAEELAKAYIRLMKRAAPFGSCGTLKSEERDAL